jgi:hypothetical protein
LHWEEQAVAERVRLVVKGSHGGNLTIEDAMQQVLDFFRLLSLSSDDDNSVQWLLTHASAASPLTVIGEASSVAPDVDVVAIARLQKAALAAELNAVLRGDRPESLDVNSERAALTQKILRRTLNGIAETDIDLEDIAPLILTTEAARSAIEVLDARPAFELPYRAHSEHGAVEGELLSSDPYYGKPAIWIEDRGGNRIPCRLSTALQEQITGQLNFADVWRHRRIVATGEVSFTEKGRINRVDADSVALLGAGRVVKLDELYDKDFTDGLTPSEYIDKLREGDIG